MSFLPNAGLVAGGALGFSSAAMAYQAGKAFNNAIQGNSTEGEGASYVQQGFTAAFGATTDKTAQLARHLSEGALYTLASGASFATAAATFDTEGSYTFGLGNFGLDLSQVTLFGSSDPVNILDQAPEATGVLASLYSAGSSVVSYLGDNPLLSLAGASVTVLTLGSVGRYCMRRYRGAPVGVNLGPIGPQQMDPKVVLGAEGK